MKKGYTIQEAADKLSISKSAMHKRVLRGTMNAEKIDGRWKVYLDDKTSGNDKGNDKGNDSKTQMSLMVLEIKYLKEQIQKLEQQLQDQKQENNKLSSMVMSALNRIPPQLAAPKKGFWNRIRGVRVERENDI